MDWSFIGVLAGLLGLWTAVLFWAVRWLLDQRFGDLVRLHESTFTRLQELEKDVLRVREEIARNYVRRDDLQRIPR